MNVKLLYKFGKREHLECLANGTVRFMPAKIYQNMEIEDGFESIADPLDATMFFRPAKLEWRTQGNEFQEHIKVNSAKYSPLSVNLLPVFCFCHASDNNMTYDDAKKVWQLNFDDETKRDLQEMCNKSEYDSVIILPYDDFVTKFGNLSSSGFKLAMDYVRYLPDNELHNKSEEIFRKSLLKQASDNATFFEKKKVFIPEGV